MNLELLPPHAPLTLVSVHPVVASSDQELAVACLERVIGSASFARARRLRRLLRHIVDATLRGASRRELSEMAIGLTVFDREPASYDPGLDPIVRVQARRLRDKLAAYYRDEGAADPLRISVPNGAYVASFQRRPLHDSLIPETPPANDPRAGFDAPEPRRRLFLVTPLICHDCDPAGLAFGARLNDELRQRLAARADLGGRQVLFHDRPADLRMLENVDQDYCLLEGSIRHVDDVARAALRLSRCDDGRVLWTGQFEHLRDGFGDSSALGATLFGAIDALCRLPD